CFGFSLGSSLGFSFGSSLGFRLFLVSLRFGLFLLGLFFDLLLLGLRVDLFAFLSSLRVSLGLDLELGPGLDLGLALFIRCRLAAREANRGGGGQRQRPLHARDLAGAAVDDDLRRPARAFVAGEVDAFLDVDAILVGVEGPHILVRQQQHGAVGV